YCGSIFVPGINCQTRLNANKRRRKQKRKQIVDIKDKYPKSVKRDNEIIQDDGSGTCKLRKATQEKRKIIHVQSDKTHSRQRADFKQKRQQYKNHLSYICNMCNRETRFTGSIMRDVSRPDQTETNKKISLWPKPHEMSTLSKKLITPSNPSSGSKSKKKKPKSQLQQFLAEEKERNNEKKDPSELLNLEDFLSSL
ncbi:10805_t:CDS:2, partial [Acaulospora morrowiae]